MLGHILCFFSENLLDLYSKKESKLCNNIPALLFIDLYSIATVVYRNDSQRWCVDIHDSGQCN